MSPSLLLRKDNNLVKHWPSSWADMVHRWVWSFYFWGFGYTFWIQTGWCVVIGDVDTIGWSLQAKSTIYSSVLILSHSHELWVVIERMRSSTQVDDISEPFLLPLIQFKLKMRRRSDSHLRLRVVLFLYKRKHLPWYLVCMKESWTRHTRKDELEEVIFKVWSRCWKTKVLRSKRWLE